MQVYCRCNFQGIDTYRITNKNAIIAEDKATELFCMADNFCKFFDAIIANYTIKPTGQQ